jgi:hypothetical protein
MLFATAEAVEAVVLTLAHLLLAGLLVPKAVAEVVQDKYHLV